MGGVGSREMRVWSEICALESDEIRATMIERVMTAPGFITAAQRGGVYGPTSAWLQAYRRGWPQPFPFATGRGDRIRLEGGGGSGWSSRAPAPAPAPAPMMYGPASAALPSLTMSDMGGDRESAMIVSPAAKALDYFQEALELLDIRESETLTHERLKMAYKRASLTAHPDKPGGSAAAFDALNRAYTYVGKILDRVRPRTTTEESARMSAPVSMESAMAARERTAPKGSAAYGGEVGGGGSPIKLSAKKLDMNVFNRLFEENRLPDPVRDSGYGDWLKGSDTGGVSSVGGIASFESKVREFAQRNPDAIIKRLEPDALIGGRGASVLGEEGGNFTADFGSDTQFTDLKEAYTTGAVAYLDVADVRVTERSARSVEEAQRIREAEMSRIDPDEKSRIAAAAAAYEARERQRQLRMAAADTTMDAWAKSMRGRLAVTDA